MAGYWPHTGHIAVVLKKIPGSILITSGYKKNHRDRTPIIFGHETLARGGSHSARAPFVLPMTTDKQILDLLIMTSL